MAQDRSLVTTIVFAVVAGAAFTGFLAMGAASVHGKAGAAIHEPGLVIGVEASGDHGTGLQTVRPGETIEWRVTVMNPSSVDLRGVAVHLDQIGLLNCPAAVESGELLECHSASTSAVAGSHVVEVLASGWAGDRPVGDMTRISYTVEGVTPGG